MEKKFMPKEYNTLLLNQTVKNLHEDNRMLDLLIEFEDVLDKINLYAYKNWSKGIVVEGPNIDRYWVDVTLMYDKKSMPDPSAVERLLLKDCKIKWTQDIFKSARRVKTPEDFETVTRNGRIFRRSKIDESPIWLVNIKMPRKFIEDVKDDIIQYSMSKAAGADDIPALEDTVEPTGDTGAIGQ